MNGYEHTFFPAIFIRIKFIYMKKQFYLLTAGLFTLCIANAQIKKGDILLGGNVLFTKQNNDVFSGYKNNNVSIAHPSE
jgi:hypothetical protein